MTHPRMNGTKDSHLGKGVSTNTSTTTSDALALNDQTQSQLQEINMFAAMANADVDMDDLNSMNENAEQEDSLEDSHQNGKEESDATGVLRDDNDNDNRSGDASAPKSPNIKSKRAHNRRASNIDISTNANTYLSKVSYDSSADGYSGSEPSVPLLGHHDDEDEVTIAGENNLAALFREQDEARRRSEMNAFAAMANPDVHDDIDNGDGDDEVVITKIAKDDTERRMNEMSASFAAMANPDTSLEGDGGDEGGNDIIIERIKNDDEMRRRNEMNSFAAMANPDLEFEDDEFIAKDVKKDDTARRLDEMSSFAAMANPDLVDEDDELIAKNLKKDDDKTRQSEINSFAAMVNLEANMEGNEVDDEYAIKNQNKEHDTRLDAMSAFAAMANKSPPGGDKEEENEALNEMQKQDFERRQNEISAFAAMANAGEDNAVKVNGSGSVRFEPAKKNKVASGGSVDFSRSKQANALENKNLGAALEMFESEIDAEFTDNPEPKAKPEVGTESFEAQQTPRAPLFDQMYTEKVMIQRPLFFGTALPDRLKNVLKDGEEDMYPEGPNGPYRPDVHQHLLSPSNQNDGMTSHRNLESAVEAFGHVYLGSRDPNFRSKENIDFNMLEMKSHVCLYEPVWGDEARLKREDRIRGYLCQDNPADYAFVDPFAVSKSADENESNAEGGRSCDSDVLVESNSMDTSLSVSTSGVSSPTAFAGDAENLIVSPQQGDFTDSMEDSNKNLFLQYARGDMDGIGGTFVGAKGTLVAVPETDTLRNGLDSKGSFEASELKKHVGLNENLSKALEQLVGKDEHSVRSSSASFALEPAEAVAGETTVPTVNNGRPLSNLEITKGKVPLYGCDDTPFPSLTDLFNPETKRDQIRSHNQYESEEMISSQVLPNVFGPLVCPSTCSGPSDSQSWYTRPNDDSFVANSDPKPRANENGTNASFDSLPKSRAGTKSTIPSPLPTPPIKGSNLSRAADSPSSRQQDSFSIDASQQPGKGVEDPDVEERVGWWSFEGKPNKNGRMACKSGLQATPKRKKLRPNDYGDLLSQSKDNLLQENRSLFEMHPAVDTVTQLPLLSDRSPNTRYIQIDTQVVGFPSLGQIEPFFCSMAIWYIEPENEKEGKEETPLRGRITESLYFDVASEQEEHNSQSILLHPSLKSNEGDNVEGLSLASTRCGVFPIPSCYEMKNLHAVLIVKKVLANDSESEIYWNNENENKVPDVAKHRNRASKAVDRVGHILTPFAFGSAPLEQIMGAESPAVPTSKAAQIPLFKLFAGEGEDPIINHIIAINHPRVRHGGREVAKVTNGGRAMLVIRNFGYLGIHSTISSKSKLARERLVDFTGELQVRRKRKGADFKREEDNDGGQINIGKEWHAQFVTEPAIDGGRCDPNANDPSLYVQELAPIPISILRPNLRNRKHLKMTSQVHTAISNELIFHPMNIENCAKRNITLKLEIARLMYRDDLNALVAIPVKNCIFNCRRGPLLVKESYTACAYHKIDPYFLDEMKIKLPFTKLKSVEHGTLIALFTAYHVTVKGKKWALKSTSNITDGNSSPMEQISCGYLPLSQGEDEACLLQDGVHSIHLKFKAKSLDEYALSPEDNIPRNTKILEAWTSNDEKKSNASRSAGESNEGKPCSIDEFLQSNASDFQLCAPGGDVGVELQSAQTSISSLSEVEKSDVFVQKGRRLEKKQGIKIPNSDQLILNVRTISLSSIHPQNINLEQFFKNMPQSPRCLEADEFSGIWKMKEEQISDELDHIMLSFDQVDMSNDRQLLQNTIEISKTSNCPQSQIVAHFIRISFQLWRSFVAGSGEPHIAFANPAMPLPLRLHSFSTLLYVLNQVTSHMTKCDVTETNGSQIFTMNTMSSLISFLFDEESIFLHPSGYPLEDQTSARRGIEDQDSTKIETDEDCKKGPIQHLQKTEVADRGSVFQKLDIEIVSDKEEPAAASVKVSPTSTQDDILLKGSAKPAPLRTRSFSAPNEKRVLKLNVDTKSDFQFALTQGLSPSGAPSPFIGAMLGPAAIRRKWSAPASASLATISEDNDRIDSNVVDSDKKKMPEAKIQEAALDNIDTEIILHNTKQKKVKQMRVPKTHESHVKDQDREDEKSITVEDSYDNDSDLDSQSSMTVPSMDEIESAGNAFLDSIDKPRGLSSSFERGGEERRAGASHHRKTKSRCSIDWSLPPKDLVIENHQQMERRNRSSKQIVSNGLNQSATHELKNTVQDGSAIKGHPKIFSSAVLESNKEDSKEHDAPESTECNVCDTSKTASLPSFRDRLVAQGRETRQGRWFPYTYEVIIFQWIHLLREQRKMKVLTKSRSSQFIGQCLTEAATKARGVSISCAPILFAVIKKSLGFRIDSLYRVQREKTKSSPDCFCAHPLISLDPDLISVLGDLISMITDACIDSRNFDSRSFRNTSIIVNNSIARFVRDLFAFIDNQTAHRLTMVYFSRFVSRDGKQCHDRYSRIGLRSSWEVSKLRLNAVTTFIRFLDFVKINRPLMDTWGDWTLKPPTRTNRHLFSEAIEELQSLDMSAIGDTDVGRQQKFVIPTWKHHWLVEFVTDLCLGSTGHVEQNIQHRSSALLYELVWNSNFFGKVYGSSTIVASLYLSFIPKLLGHVTHLSSLHPKSQLRKDLLPCFVFVLQSAPFGLLRALWRKLFKCTEGKGATGNYGEIYGTEDSEKANSVQSDDGSSSNSTSADSNIDNSLPCILDLCSLLNLSLTTFEYEGSESSAIESTQEMVSYWHTEYLLSTENCNPQQKFQQNTEKNHFTSTSSRKWHSHDAATVIITTCRNIVREYVSMLNLSGKNISTGSSKGPIASFSNSPVSPTKGSTPSKRVKETIQFSFEDKVLFLRAVSSVYLHCLSLRQSDVVLSKTLLASTEILKVFGIELFLTAAGETLQHWMRVILLHCGGRRAKLRVEALDFLALILRLQWNSFGSFTRVRVPLLAVATEVFDRIVTTAATRYGKTQKHQNEATEQYISNIKAEASLTPLWRTLTRLHDGSQSNNASFKSALQLLANKLRTLYKSYIATHAHGFVHTMNSKPEKNYPIDDSIFEATNVVRESGAEFSKTILGYNQVSTNVKHLVLHDEVVESAFFAAANVFSPTELPGYRVVWLRKLASFHASRSRSAEEAACRLQIHKTLKQAAVHHDNLWHSRPFWPWVKEVNSYGEGPASNSRNHHTTDSLNGDHRMGMNEHDEGTQSFRRIFYRVVNSLRMRTGDWDVGGTKTLFYGVTFASEYGYHPSWTDLHDLEKEMVLQAEDAGSLFLNAGIIESSRFCWGLATQIHSDMCNYLRLAHCYQELAHVVASQVPIIDTNKQQEPSSPLGRFYRVHFHGGAANEFTSKEFVYRAPARVIIEEFCKNLKQTFKAILHEKTEIELVLDDGRPQNTKQNTKRRQLGAPIGESITIKVTPLKPLLSMDKCPRGSAEWFYQQTEIPDFKFQKNPVSAISRSNHINSLGGGRSYRPFSTINSNQNSFGRPTDTHKTFRRLNNKSMNVSTGGEEIGVYKFSYTQPRDRLRGSRDVLKAQHADVSEKSLRVTELLVPESMPTSVTRQPVTVGNRSVFNQSPLEAGVEQVCSWCAVLFRTAVATNASAVIADRSIESNQGIGKAAMRVISECIHRSTVKEIGIKMLVHKRSADSKYEKLSSEELSLHQMKLARAIIIFMELLHVLIGRNRDILLNINHFRRRRTSGGSHSLQFGMPPSPGQLSQFDDVQNKTFDDYGSTLDEGSTSRASTMDRTDNAMAIQRELQLSFVRMTKTLHPLILSKVRDETPKWMRICCQGDYFSSGAYKQARIAIGEELLFFGEPSHEYSHYYIKHLDPSGVPFTILPPEGSDHESYAGSDASRTQSVASSTRESRSYTYTA